MLGFILEPLRLGKSARGSAAFPRLRRGPMLGRVVMADADWFARVVDSRRVQVLRRTDLLDSAAEEGFDRLTRLSSELLGAPIALVSLVDERRQFFKSSRGLGQPWAARWAQISASKWCSWCNDIPGTLPSIKHPSNKPGGARHAKLLILLRLVGCCITPSCRRKATLRWLFQAS